MERRRSILARLDHRSALRGIAHGRSGRGVGYALEPLLEAARAPLGTISLGRRAGVHPGHRPELAIVVAALARPRPAPHWSDGDRRVRRAGPRSPRFLSRSPRTDP